MTPEELEQLERLAALRDRGALNEAEFEAAKARLLGTEPPPPSDSAREPAPAETTGPPPALEWPEAPPAPLEPSAQPTEPAPAGSEPEPTSLGPDAPAEPPTVPSAPESPFGREKPPHDSTWEPLPLEASTTPEVTSSPAAVPSPPPIPPEPAAFTPSAYPVAYGVAYPGSLSRWKTLLRVFFLLPVWLFLYLVQSLIGALFAIGWTTVFWRKKYPSWAFAGLSGAFGFTARAWAYALLQTDKFPSFDKEDSPVTLIFEPPPSGHLSRWRVLFWKLFLLIPHMAVLSVLYLALFVVTILAWFGIVFTGNYPRGMFPFATGVARWQYRVTAYFASFTDYYPPYSLQPEAGPASKGATITSGIGGWLAGGAFTALIVAASVIGGRPHNEDASYAALQQGRGPVSVRINTGSGDVILTLARITDPGDDLVRIIETAPGERAVVFEWHVQNTTGSSQDVSADASFLRAQTPEGTHTYHPQFIIVDDRAAPVSIAAHASPTIQAVYVIPDDATPTELRFHRGFAGLGGVRYRFP